MRNEHATKSALDPSDCLAHGAKARPWPVSTRQVARNVPGACFGIVIVKASSSSLCLRSRRDRPCVVPHRDIVVLLAQADRTAPARAARHPPAPN
jgi:hypothetical protein